MGGSSKEVLGTIIGHGADVNAKNKHDVTALMQACKKGSVEIINVLLNAGADSSIADINGATSIHYAVVGGCSKGTLQSIIGQGADVNASNKDNVTALMIACLKGDVETINVLLIAGADLNISTDEHGTCILHAIIGGCSKDVLATIIDHGVNVNATCNNNRTALMLACQKGNLDAIDVLLNAGANPNIADYEGATWIDYAVAGGCEKEAHQAIISHGGDVNATNKNNLKP